MFTHLFSHLYSTYKFLLTLCMNDAKAQMADKFNLAYGMRIRLIFTKVTWFTSWLSALVRRDWTTVIRFILGFNKPFLRWWLLGWKSSSDLCKKAFFAPKIEKTYSPNPRLKRTGYKKGGGGTENSTALSPGNNGQRRQVDKKTVCFFLNGIGQACVKKGDKPHCPTKLRILDKPVFVYSHPEVHGVVVC